MPAIPYPGITVLTLLAAAPACAPAVTPSADPTPAAPVTTSVQCEPGDTAMVRDVVYFGRNRPDGGTVSAPSGRPTSIRW